MVVSIYIPRAANQQFGPGYLLQGSTSFIGPIESGSYWEAKIQTTTTPTYQAAITRYHSAAGSFVFVFNEEEVLKNYYIETPALNPMFSDMPAGMVLKLIVDFKSPANVTLDTGNINITYDPQSATAWLVQQMLLKMGGTSESLADIRAAVYRNFPSA